MTELIALRALSDVLKPERTKHPISRVSPRMKRIRDAFVPNRYVRPLLLAIEDARRVVAHVHVLLAGDFSDSVGLSDWLSAADSVFDPMLEAIYEGRLDVVPVTLEFRADEVTDSIFEFFADDYFQADNGINKIIPDELSESPAIQLLARNIDYWVGEIRNRGLQVFHLAVGAEVLFDYEKSLDHLKSMRFPGD